MRFLKPSSSPTVNQKHNIQLPNKNTHIPPNITLFKLIWSHLTETNGFLPFSSTIQTTHRNYNQNQKPTILLTQIFKV
ncbi:hypothetical protein RJT34_03681 [Clitoria ternatea]|uniref:Uncharacterized protein n=1 Tax=Clitoria ternatea TaxID=43366 RepID=A0AAN9KK85_CLITE